MVVVINIAAGAFIFGVVLASMIWAIATQSSEDGIAPWLRPRPRIDRHATRARRARAQIARRSRRFQRQFAARRGPCDL